MGNKEWIKLEKPGKKETRRVVTSPNRESEVEKTILAKLGAERQRVGGAGRKVHVLLN